MAEFKLGRIRFVWKGDWNTATAYYKDDVVRYGGRTYICQVGHTSAADFNTDLEYSPTKWNQMTDGQDWKGDWATSTFYKLNDIVKYGGLLYICNDSHTSASSAASGSPGLESATGLEADQSKWTLYSEGLEWKDDWTTTTRYKKNDLVKYGGYTYVCNTGHTSAATVSSGLENNQSYWDEFNQGIEYKGTWASTTRYKKNDVVKYGAGLWICGTQHTSTASFSSDASNWSQFVKGFEFESTWSSSTTYQPGDIVGYGGNQYISKTNHSNAVPSTDTTNWDLFTEGFNFSQTWSNSSTYKIGDVVALGGHNYLAVADSSSYSTSATASSAVDNTITLASTTGMAVGMSIVFSGTSFGNINIGATYYIKTIPTSGKVTITDVYNGTVITPTTASGTMTVRVSAQPPHPTYWTRLSSGINWQGAWQDDTQYLEGDSVRYGSNAYICVKAHRSEADDGSTIREEGGGAPNSRPDIDSTGTYWSVLAIGSEVDVLSARGDLVYFGGSGPTRLPVGREGQVLRAGAVDPEWVTLGETDQVYYVAPHGTDLPSPVWGKTWDKPFKTIRYACEQVEKGARNPDAVRLLEMNRIFIQKEVTAWIREQITTNTSPFTSSFDYDEYKCERDVGFIIDRLVNDITQGGNLKIRAAVQTFFNALDDGPYSNQDDSNGTGPYNNLAVEAAVSSASYSYMLTVVESVLDNQAPDTIYQNVSDDSTAIVTQYIDTAYTAESGAVTEIRTLVGYITTAFDTYDETSGTAAVKLAAAVATIPERYIPNKLINVATGQYRETLPIIVPAQTCILGDELRSTNAGPAGSLIDPSDAFYSIKTFDHLTNVVSDIVTGTSVTPTSGNTETQATAYPVGDTDEAAAVEKLVQLMKHQADFKTRSLASATLTDPTGYDSSYLVGYGKARKLIKENKKFFQEEIIAWLAVNYPNSKYQKTLTRRDTGYIIDALVYDLTYGGNSLSVQAGLAYYDGDDNTQPQISSSIKTLTLAAITYLKSIVQTAAVNGTVSNLQSAIPQFRDTAGSAAAQTLIGNNIDDIIEIIDLGPAAVGTTVTLTDSTPSNGVNSTTTLINEYNLLEGGDDFDQVKDVVEAYLAANYSDVDYSVTKARRDAGIVLKAIGFDMMYNSNYQTIKAAYAYLRPTSSELFDRDDRIKEATRNSLIAARDEALTIISDSTAESRLTALYDIVDTIIYSGSTEGDVCQTELRSRDYAILKLEENRDFIKSEVTAYIDSTFSQTATNTTATSDLITVTSTANLVRNTAIKFTGTVFGGITANTTYYVQNIVSSTTFTIGTTRYALSPVTLSTASGNMTVELVYNSALCLRDVDTYIDALKWDLKYTSNYKSFYVARYYANAMLGSYEEDMYYLRDGTGIRDQTLEGLNGDLTPENTYGTSRVTAGAYASLDPGWGPADFRTWILSRSPYVQGVTTFGNAAIGQKIDGALHNGGNDSMVSNDFTQVISDGIGAWVTNNGRAELVSVFTYYSHIGYLSEAGGRIRGTNGNNSYGDFGSVAEGFDSTEIPDTASVDNKFQFDATVQNVFTNGSAMFNFEFENAGIDYTEATWTLTGGGSGASVVQDEFRDGAVYQVRLLDLGDDSSGQYGGDGYITNSNTAQGGSSTSITLAATDPENSTAYIGMKVIVTGGAGVGQYAIITSYNSGTKVAGVVRDSNGVAGWDHLIPGTTIVSPDASTTYTVEPRITFSSPTTTSAGATLPSSAVWNDVTFGETTGVYTSLTASTYTGSGTGANFTVIRNGTKYSSVSIQTAGTGYERLETITISGANLGGATPANDIEITITAVNSVTGAILEIDSTGIGIGGRYVAVKSGSTNKGAYSNDGQSWTEMTLPSSGDWTGVAHGLIDDGSSVGKISRFVAIKDSSTGAAWSENGITWTASTLPASTAWTSVTYANGAFIAISSTSTTVAISLDGEFWDLTGTLPSTGFLDVAGGKGYFVAVKNGDSGAIAYSTTGTGNWTAANMPANSSWNSVAYGMNMFVAVATDSNSGAYSINGSTWTTSTIGSPDSSSPAGYQTVRYGQGIFVATSWLTGLTGYSYIAKSENGLLWDHEGVSDGDTDFTVAGHNALAFGNSNQSGYWVLLGKDSGDHAVRVKTGATARARALVSENKIYAINILEPGSGYTSAPTMTITDPNNTYELPFEVRIGNGSLANPSFVTRGTGYTTGSAAIDTGDGYADFYQPGSFVAVRRLSARPVPGSNVVFGHLPDRTFKLVNVVTFLGTNDGAYTAFLQISPALITSEAPDHETAVTTRIRYSQVRLTGHDFLDIGTGGFADTNYPGTPTQDPIPDNETVESNGGRVFYTATDQDGNFRVGALFNIEQSTGIATLNADAFNISGLQELNLGDLTLGGGSATVTEFSTDPFFTANSDNIVPTQRAIKAYIASQIGGGGASLNVNSVTAGSVFISNNQISTTTGGSIKMNATFEFRGGVIGLPIAFNYFLT